MYGGMNDICYDRPRYLDGEWVPYVPGTFKIQSTYISQLEFGGWPYLSDQDSLTSSGHC